MSMNRTRNKRAAAVHVAAASMSRLRHFHEMHHGELKSRRSRRVAGMLS